MSPLTFDGPNVVFLAPVVEPPCPELHHHQWDLRAQPDVLDIVVHDRSVGHLLEVHGHQGYKQQATGEGKFYL